MNWYARGITLSGIAVVALAGFGAPGWAQDAPAGVVPILRAVGEPESAAQRRQPTRRRSSARRTPVRTARAAAPAASSFSSPRSALALAADLGSVLRAHTRGGTWGVIVTSVTRGDTLYSMNPDTLLKPASIMKMMTTGLALERLGPDYTIKTQVLRDGRSNGDVLDVPVFEFCVIETKIAATYQFVHFVCRIANLFHAFDVGRGNFKFQLNDLRQSAAVSMLFHQQLTEDIVVSEFAASRIFWSWRRCSPLRSQEIFSKEDCNRIKKVRFATPIRSNNNGDFGGKLNFTPF